eukprot:5523526-Pyramimonas_sp.AAC.1
MSGPRAEAARARAPVASPAAGRARKTGKGWYSTWVPANVKEEDKENEEEEERSKEEERKKEKRDEEEEEEEGRAKRRRKRRGRRRVSGMGCVFP